MDKKKPNVFLRIMSILFIIFMGLFIANVSGYYETKIRNNVSITEEGIKEFEEKVQNGESIDINSYLKNERIDYSSKMSRLGDNLTSSLEEFVDDSAKILADILKSLF